LSYRWCLSDISVKQSVKVRPMHGIYVYLLPSCLVHYCLGLCCELDKTV
jgi:hypothetical protein